MIHKDDDRSIIANQLLNCYLKVVDALYLVDDSRTMTFFNKKNVFIMLEYCKNANPHDRTFTLVAKIHYK